MLSSSPSFCSASTASSSLLAADDNNMTTTEFENLPKQTREILKMIQIINDVDDFSFNSEAADEIMEHILQHNAMIHYEYNRHDYNDDGKSNNYYYNPSPLFLSSSFTY